MLEAVVALCLVAGCGGSSVDQVLRAGLPDRLPSFPSVGSGPFSQSEITTYANFPSFDFSSVPLGLPGGASATYDGIVELKEFAATGDRDYVGRSTLTADFTGGTISGTTSNFIEVTGIETTSPGITGILGGSVPITSGSITGLSFSAQFDGVLTNGGRNLSIDTSVDGIFGTVNGQSLALGIVNGTVNDGTTVNSMSGAITGNKR